MEEELKIEITPEQRDLIIKGIRPDDIPYETYRFLRKASQDALTEYKKGRLVHLSSEIVTEKTDKGKITYVKKHKPYVKETEKDVKKMDGKLVEVDRETNKVKEL